MKESEDYKKEENKGLAKEMDDVSKLLGLAVPKKPDEKEKKAASKK